MRISIIGAITWDFVSFPSRIGYSGLGGILYNAIAATSLTENEVSIFANVGYDVTDQLERFLKLQPNIQSQNLKFRSQKNVRCYLAMFDDLTLEWHQQYPPKLTINQLEPALESDLILLTFPIGYEVSLQTIKAFKKRFKGLLFIDYHTLSLSTDQKGIRYWRKRNTWLEWVKGADIVQFNRDEASFLWGKPVESEESIKSFSQEIIGTGSTVVIVTLGKDGCLTAEKTPKGIKAQKHTGKEVDVVNNTIGCGDIFASTFLIAYAQTGKVDFASSLAIQASALNCRGNQLEEVPDLLRPLRKLLKQEK